MELVENPYVSDFTRATLTQFKWAVGDPIPVDLGDLMLKIKDRLPPSSRTDVLIDVHLMSEEDIAQINTMLDEARTVDQRRRKAAAGDDITANMTPSVREAYERVTSTPLPGPEIVDDRAAPAQSPEPAPTPEPEATVKESLPVQTQEQFQPVVLPFCPRCGWDMRQRFDVEITDADKEHFVAALLGNFRFRKQYSLLGGNILLTLRSMTSAENKLVYQQLLADQKADVVQTEPEWYAKMIEYRLACSLDSVSDKTGKLIHSVPELAKFESPPGGQPLDTAIPNLLSYVNDEVLTQEVFKRLVGTYLREFQRLVEALEAMALEPSFWNGIA